MFSPPVRSPTKVHVLAYISHHLFPDTSPIAPDCQNFRCARAPSEHQEDEEVQQGQPWAPSPSSPRNGGGSWCFDLQARHELGRRPPCPTFGGGGGSKGVHAFDPNKTRRFTMSRPPPPLVSQTNLLRPASNRRDLCPGPISE